MRERNVLKFERHALAGRTEANFTFCFKSLNFQSFLIRKKKGKKTFSINRTIPPFHVSEEKEPHSLTKG